MFALTLEPHNTDLINRLESVKKIRANNQPTLPSTLAIECRTNPFLRVHIKEIIDVAEHHFQKNGLSESLVFTAIREKKDCF